MESITTTIAGVVREWRGSQQTDEDIVNNILGQASRFASNLFMPDLNPIMAAICTYARVAQSEEKVNQVIETMKE